MEDARALARAIHRDPCGGLPRDRLPALLGWDAERVRQAMWRAYRRGWIDFIRDYLVAVPQ
jgi:hypothetical protein